MPATVAPRIDGLNDPPLSAAKTNLTLLPVAAPVTAQRILAVEFRSSDGRSWSAIGGGDTVAAALDWARECCPDDTSWELLGWEDLYGD
jgi:hypothetical protein